MNKKIREDWKEILEWWRVIMKKMNDVKAIKLIEEIMKMCRIKKNIFFFLNIRMKKISTKVNAKNCKEQKQWSMGKYTC